MSLDILHCGSTDINVSEPTRSNYRFFYSHLSYTCTMSTPVYVSMWIVSVLVILLSVSVIVWRCRKRTYSSQSVLIINLAVSDALMGLGRILRVKTFRMAHIWCTSASNSIIHLCYVTSMVSNIPITMMIVLFLAIPLCGMEEVCCITQKQTVRRFLYCLIAVGWIISVLVWVTSNWPKEFKTRATLNFTIDWTHCAGYSLNEHLLGTVTQLTSLCIILVVIALSYYVIVAAVSRQMGREQFYLQAKRQLIAIVLSMTALLGFEFGWKIYLLLYLRSHYYDAKLRGSESFRIAYKISMFVPLGMALLNPFLYTFWNKITLRRYFKMMTCGKWNEKETGDACSSAATQSSEETRLFSESTQQWDNDGFSTDSDE